MDSLNRIWHWASQQVQEEAHSVTQIRSHEANRVFRLDYAERSLYLKIGPALAHEHERLCWLETRFPAPRPLGFVSDDCLDALLMSALPGNDLAALSSIVTSQEIIARLSTALKVLHTSEPIDWTFGGTGSVLVHGDACLPNFLFCGDHFTGIVDVGDMALGEIETDLSAAIWSLHKNLGSGYGSAFLREYGWHNTDEGYTERLRLRYKQG